MSAPRVASWKVAALGISIVLLALGGLANVQATPQMQAEATLSATMAATLSGTAQAPSIQPGDTVDGITFLKVKSPDSSVLDIFQFCSPTPDSIDKTIFQVCDVPNLSQAYMTVGLTTSASNLEKAWKSTQYEITFEGRPIDLAAFGTVDADVTDNAGAPAKARSYVVEMDKLTSGLYTFVQLDHFSQLVQSGSLQLQGDYTITLNLNIGPENYAAPCPNYAAALQAASAKPSATAAATAAATGAAFLGIQYNASSCGAVIGAVTPGSPATKAKLLNGDLILAVDGAPVITLPYLRPLPVGARPGQNVMYTIQRHGRILNVPVTLGARTQ